MTRYMLDTNTVSYFIKGNSKVTQKILSHPIASLSISSITAGELWFGLAKRPTALQLHKAIKAFLRRVDTFDWDETTAECYGFLRAKLQSQGITLQAHDLLIAAHALSVKARLVTNDHVFKQIPDLWVEDWAT